MGTPTILREPEIKLKRGGSSADLQAMSRTIDRALGDRSVEWW